MKPIVVLNPNSTEAVSEGLSAALEPLRMAGGPAIRCETLAEGPPAIESDADAAGVVEPVCRFLREHEDEAGAFVIACFSDPGLHPGRHSTSRPVFGMAESGLLTALARGNRFGVLSILEESVPRHLEYYRAMRIEKRLAGDLPIGLGVLELGDDARAMQRMRSTGVRLRDELGADVVVMGCAGMARLRAPLERALGIPVVEPVQAAVTMAIGAVRLADAAA